MPTRTDYAHGEFCWVDLVAHDMQAAIKFYSDLFGWTARNLTGEGMPPYTQFEQGGQGVAGIGQMSDEMKGQGIPPMWNSYINVDNVEDTFKRAIELGATASVPPMKVMDAGWLAFFMDPTGASTGLWQKGQHCGAQLVNDPVSLCWNELATKDVEKPLDFYAKLLDWKYEFIPQAPGSYHVIKNNGRRNGGIFNIQAEWGNIPPNWGVYFHVNDVNATVEKTKQQDGKAMCDPIETTVGPMGVLTDAQGACFSVIKLTNVPAN